MKTTEIFTHVGRNCSECGHKTIFQYRCGINRFYAYYNCMICGLNKKIQYELSASDKRLLKQLRKDYPNEEGYFD